MSKQADKLKPLNKLKIYNVFHLSLLEKDTFKKKQVKKILEFNTSKKDSKEYMVEVIKYSAVYTNKSKSGHLSGLYNLVVWKGYSKEKHTLKSLLVVQYLKKLISFFYKNRLEKPITTFLFINSALPMARLIIKPIKLIKQKPGQLAKSISKQPKNFVCATNNLYFNWPESFSFYRIVNSKYSS